MNEEKPRVGLGIILENSEGKILIGKRLGKHAPFYSIPGGHLELGESFEEGAIREIKEETNLDITDPRVIAVTNNLHTFHQEGKHYISVILHARFSSGDAQVMEPDKCAQWLWCDPQQLPQPHFDASELGVLCFLNKSCYEGAFS